MIFCIIFVGWLLFHKDLKLYGTVAAVSAPTRSQSQATLHAIKRKKVFNYSSLRYINYELDWWSVLFASAPLPSWSTVHKGFLGAAAALAGSGGGGGII